MYITPPAQPFATPTQVAPPAATLTPASSASTTAPSSTSTFGDVLDTINPLQHIPVLSSAYRSMTGSAISSEAQIAGDTLYGALLGGGTLIAAAVSGAASTADVTVQQTTGNDITGHVLSTLGMAATASTSQTTTASTNPTPPLETGKTLSASSVPAYSAGSQTTLYAWQHPEAVSAHYARTLTLDTGQQYLAAMGTRQAVRKSNGI